MEFQRRRARGAYDDDTGLNNYLEKISIYFNIIRRTLPLNGKLINTEMQKEEMKFFGKKTYNIFEVFDEQIERIKKSSRYSKTMARKYKNAESFERLLFCP